MGMLHAVEAGRHNPDVEQALLPPPIPAPGSPIPGHTSQAYFASAASLAPSNSQALMGQCLPVSHSSMRVHARWHENTHNIQLASQTKTLSTHRVRA